MNEATKNKVWNYLEVVADNARLRAEVARLTAEKRELEQNHQTITRLAEQQALELLQARQGRAARVKWKCQIVSGIQLEAYTKLLNEGWEIVHRQFETGRLNVVAQKQMKIEPPEPPKPNGASRIQIIGLDAGTVDIPVVQAREERKELNAGILAAMQRSYVAAGGGKPFRSIEEMAYGRGTSNGSGRRNPEAANGDSGTSRADESAGG